MCRPRVSFILSLLLMVLHHPRGWADVVDPYNEATLHDSSLESFKELSKGMNPSDLWLERTKRQLVGVHIPEPLHSDQEYIDGFREFNRFLAEQGFDGFAHIGSSQKFTSDSHGLPHSAHEEFVQVGEASGYGHHHDQGGYKEPQKKIKAAPYKGPRYSPYDLIAPSKSKIGKKTKYGDDPVNESKKGIYHLDKQDLPIKHFGGFGGGGSIGYNSGSLNKGHHGGDAYKGFQSVHKGHQGGYKAPTKGGPGIGGFKGHGISGSKGHNIGGFKGHTKGGFKGHGISGLKGHDIGGFKGHGISGLKGHDIGGFKGHGKGGFKGHSKGGFEGHGVRGNKGHNFGEFKGHGKGGLDGHGIVTLQGHGPVEFDGHSSGGIKGHTLPIHEAHDLNVYQAQNSGGLKGHHIEDHGHGQFVQRPQNVHHGFESHYDPNPVVQHIEQPFNTYDVHTNGKVTSDLAKPDVTLMLLSDPYNLPHSDKAVGGYLA